MLKKLVVLVMILSVVAVAQANLLDNPSFEDNGGGGSHPWWWGGTDDLGAQNWMDGEVFQAHSGEWLAAVMHWSGTGTGNFYQDNIAVSENTDYVYTMWAKRDGSAWVGTYNMTVEWYGGANLLGESTLDITAGITDTEWNQFSLDATSMAGSDNACVMIEFVDVGTDWTNGCGKFDDASFAEVPEPATMALLGLGGLALLRRKRS